MMFLSQNMKKVIVTYSQDLNGHCRECNGDGNKPALLVEAGLVLEQAWCQQDEQHSNVSLTECDAHQEGKLTDHSKNIDNIAANTVEN